MRLRYPALVDLLLPSVLAFAIGAFLVLTNSNIPFANGPSCDTWHFFGRFFVGDQPSALPYSREGSRVPEFIFGYIFERFAHGVRVEYANFFVFFVAASLGVYYAARALFNSFAAYAALIFFAAQPLILANFAVTYTEGATAYSALAMAFAIRAAAKPLSLRKKYLLLTAGFFWAAAFHAHLESLTMNFIVGLYCIDWGERSQTKLLRDAAEKWIFLAIGAVGATVVLGIINVLVFHGSVYFFVKQFHDVATVSIIEYVKSNWYLLGGRGALLVASAALIFGQAFWLWRSDASLEKKTPVKTALFPFIVLVVAQLGYTFLDHGLALQYDYWFAWILAPFSLLVASVAYRVRVSGVLAASLLALYLAASISADFGRLDLLWQVGTIPICFSIALIAFPIIVWLLIRKPDAAAVAGAIILVLLAATIRPEKIGLLVWGWSSQRDVYKRIDAGMEFLAKHHFASNPKFWMNSRGDRWETIAYPRSYSGCLAQNLLPDLIPPDTSVYNPGAETFKRGDYLVMVPSDAGQQAVAIKTLAKKGFAFREIDRRSVSYNGLAYIIVIGKLE